MAYKDQPESSKASLPSPTWVPQSPEAGLPLALRALELEGAGPWEEAVPRTPPELGKRARGYRASRVGEFKESDDWSPLLLLLR